MENLRKLLAGSIITILVVGNFGLMPGFAEDSGSAAAYQEGYYYYAEGKYDQAIELYQKAIAAKADFTAAYFWLAKCYYAQGNYDQAIVTAQKAKAVDPNFAGVNDFIRRIETAKAGGAVPIPPGSRTITLDLKNADIQNVLRAIAKDSGLNIVAGADVSGPVTVSLKNVPPEAALSTILSANGYKYTKEDNIIKVFADAEKTGSLGGGTYLRSFQANYISLDDAKSMLSKIIPNASFLTNDTSKSIVAYGSDSYLQKVERILKAIDIPPQQVMVEARIMEVSLGNTDTLGTDVKYTRDANNNVQTTGLASKVTSSSPVGVYAHVLKGDLEAYLSALQQRSGYNLLASPKVTAVNKQSASIIIGSKFGYRTRLVTSAGITESVEFLDVGTKLSFTPIIGSDGRVILEIHPEISEGSIQNDLPQKNTTETTTKIIVMDGDTVIIGGLIREKSQESTSGVPFISNIPIIGIPFRSRSVIKEKKELIIAITPHIMSEANAEELLQPIKNFEKQRQEYNPSILY